MKTITFFYILLATIFFITSCTGPRGIDGIDGRDGRDGIDGRDGVANVGSAIYDVEPSAWMGNIDGFTTILDVPEITDYVFNNGAVLVYVIQNESSDDKSFNQLPYTWLNNNITEYMDFDAYLGSIKITLRWVDNGVNNTEAPTSLYTFKIIVIEGTPLSVLEANVDVSNPDAVLNFIN